MCRWKIITVLIKVIIIIIYWATLSMLTFQPPVISSGVTTVYVPDEVGVVWSVLIFPGEHQAQVTCAEVFSARRHTVSLD